MSAAPLCAAAVRIVPFAERHRSQSRSVAIDFKVSRLPHEAESWEDWAQEVVILSVGLAPARQSNGFYAVSAMTPAKVRMCADWTREKALPLLQARVPALVWTTGAQLKYRLAEYLADLQERFRGPMTAVASWEGNLVLLQRVMESLAPDLALAHVEADAVAPWRRELEAARQGLTRHNALDDAIWLRRVLGFESNPNSAPGRIL